MFGNKTKRTYNNMYNITKLIVVLVLVYYLIELMQFIY